MTERARVTATVAAVFVFAIAYIVLLFDASSDCDAKHGKLVQGIVWYECVGRPEAK